MKQQSKFLSLALCSILAACQSSDQNKAKPPLPQVVTAKVIEQTVPVIMNFAGTVRGSKQVQIKPQVSGYIKKQFFTDGSHVKSDDPLFQIDPRPFKAQLDASTAQLNHDQASLEFWNQEVQRYVLLSKKGFVSDEKLDSAKTRQKEFSAAVQKDQADIEQAKLNLEYCLIKAPFDGWIQETKVYEGAIVTALQTELTTLTRLNPVYVDFQISRRDAYTIQQLSVQGLGPQKRSDITATITLPDNSLYSRQGYVDYSSASFNPDTDTMTTRAIFPNISMVNGHQYGLGLTLTPGQYVPINLTVGKHPDALLIPQTALMQTQQGSFVYVLNQDNTVEQRILTLGPAYKSYWLVKTGLKAGEQVISQGLQKVKKPGVKVKPVAYKIPNSAPHQSTNGANKASSITK